MSVTTVQAAGGGVMVWGMFSACLSIVSDHVHPFMATISSDGYFQLHNAPCHKARIISNWFLENDNEFTALK